APRRSPRDRPRVASGGGAAGQLVDGGSRVARYRCDETTRRRTAKRESDVLAPRDQLRAIVPLRARLATALSGADGRRAGDRAQSAARLARRVARSRPDSRARDPAAVVAAGVRVPHTTDDR